MLTLCAWMARGCHYITIVPRCYL